MELARLKVASLAPNKVEETKLRERLAALQAQLAKTKIRAEVSGIILTRNVEPGGIGIRPSQTLFTIALDGATVKYECHLMNEIYHCWLYNKKPE